MRHIRPKVAATAFALALVVAVSTAAVASGKDARGVGEGAVVAKRSFYAVKGPWLVWNKSACEFQPTTKHPRDYVAELRKTDGLRVVYATADTALPPSKQINASFDTYSKLAGIDMKVFNNEFPSKTKPLQIADQAAAVKPDVVVSSVWIPELYGQITKTYKRACVPFINMFNITPLDRIPGFQAGFPASGQALAQGVIAAAKEKKWPSGDTWMLICGQPLTGNRPGTDVDVITTFKPIVQKALKIPASQISPILDCSGGPQAARVVTTDWLTAHPQAKYVIAMTIADTNAVGMVQAIEAKGYTSKNAVAAGGQANDPALQVMAKPGSIFYANFDKDFPTWGLIGMAMAEDIAAGRPVPYFADPGVKAVIGPDAAKKLLAERKKLLRK